MGGNSHREEEVLVVSWIDLFCHASWTTQFSDLRVVGLSSVISDHIPIILNFELVQKWGARPFRSLDIWIRDTRFKNLIMEEWEKLADKPINHKLKVLKAPIKKWNKESFGNVDVRIKKLQAKMHILEVISDSRDLNDIEEARANALKSELQLWKVKKGQIIF